MVKKHKEATNEKKEKAAKDKQVQLIKKDKEKAKALNEIVLERKAVF